MSVSYKFSDLMEDVYAHDTEGFALDTRRVLCNCYCCQTSRQRRNLLYMGYPVQANWWRRKYGRFCGQPLFQRQWLVEWVVCDRQDGQVVKDIDNVVAATFRGQMQRCGFGIILNFISRHHDAVTLVLCLRARSPQRGLRCRIETWP